MMTKLPITYPALPEAPIEQVESTPVVRPASWQGVSAERSREILRLTAGVLMTAILVLAFVLASQGIGREDSFGPGPDRPPHPVPGAAVPEPD